MSSLIIKRVEENGLVRAHKILANAWYGAPYIWAEMSTRYLGGIHAYVDHPEDLWALAKDPKVPYAHRLVLASTFDWGIVEAKRAPELGRMYRDFRNVAIVGGDKEVAGSHMTTIAMEMETMPKEAKGMCFRWTSVSEDLWTVFEKEGSERPYDINRDTKHFFVFERYEKLAELTAHSPSHP